MNHTIFMYESKDLTINTNASLKEIIMANLVSPGVSVTVTDESFFIPAAAATVPLFFIATADEKKRPDGITDAAGTFEHNVIRTVTSLKQSTELYGVPRFLEDVSGNPYHGDVRNEYGVFALNQFLGVGDLAYVVRANVNLNDNLVDIRSAWDVKMQESAYVLENLINAYLNEWNVSNGFTLSAGQTAVNTLGTVVPGSGYTAGVYTNTPLTSLTGVGYGATANITVVSSAVQTVGIIVPGSFYTDGVYTAVPLTGGTGTGAQATVTVAGGIVTTVVITAPGVGYTVGNVLSASNVNIGGTGSGFSVPVTATSGAVTAVTIVTRGAGYTVGDSLSATLPLGTGFNVPVATLTGYKTTVDEATVLSLATTATQNVWESFSFQNSESSCMDDWTAHPKPVYPVGYDAAPVGTFVGFAGVTADWVLSGLGGVIADEWTAMEAGNTLLGVADTFKYTTDFLSQTSLGANDAARRVAVVTALQAAINSNTDIRSETYEYNLILCPGFPEVVDEMLNLCIDIQEEAMVIADTPFNQDPDEVVTWAATSSRRSSRNIAYYYPHGLASNLDGKDVFIAASGTALRTITYSDDVSELWFAPAGTRRGLVSGVSMVGYVSGTLGGPTTFNEVALNLGQRNNLYKYFTNINPIVFFPGRGIIVWGQKTSAPDASAMDRINVVRLIAYIKRQLRKNTMSYVFEPNDQLTRDNIKATVDSFLGDLIVKRGLYDFATVCDESNNTPDRIDRNELYVDIALKPVRAAEFIYIPIRVVATGAEI